MQNHVFLVVISVICIVILINFFVIAVILTFFLNKNLQQKINFSMENVEMYFISILTDNF